MVSFFLGILLRPIDVLLKQCVNMVLLQHREYLIII